MTPVYFDAAALDDSLQAIAYYEDKQAGLGLCFKESVDRAVESIARMPLSYRVLTPPFRRCLLPGFPYGIIFTIEPDFIYVVAVAHAKRKPGYWAKRKRR